MKLDITFSEKIKVPFSDPHLPQIRSQTGYNT